MSDSIFTTAPSNIPEGALKSQRHSTCAILDAEDPSAYRFGHSQHDTQGTLVPIPSPNGGIQGSDNPFGKIVVGEEVRFVNGRAQSKPFTPTWLADAIPKKRSSAMSAQAEPQLQPQDMSPFPDILDAPDPAAQAAADAEVAAMKEESRRRAQAAVDAQAQADAELSDLLSAMNPITAAAPPPGPVQSAPPAMNRNRDVISPELWKQMLTAFQAMQVQTTAPVGSVGVQEPEADGYDPRDIPPTKVKLSGSFGTSRGTYKYVHMTGDLIILVYDQDANIFTPPAAETPFKLSCNGEEHNVYFAGVEFDLPFFECGIQVMIRSE
jgi:hypothetical protein